MGHSLKGSRKTITINEFGYGNVGKQKIVIINRPINKLGLEDVVVYLSYENLDSQ